MTYAEITMKSGAVVRIDCDSVTGKTDAIGGGIRAITFHGSSNTKRRHVFVATSEIAAVVEVED